MWDCVVARRLPAGREFDDYCLHPSPLRRHLARKIPVTNKQAYKDVEHELHLPAVRLSQQQAGEEAQVPQRGATTRWQTLGEVLLTTLGNFLVRSNSQSFTVGGFELEAFAWNVVRTLSWSGTGRTSASYHDQRRGTGADKEPLDAAVPTTPEEPSLVIDGNTGNVVCILQRWADLRCSALPWSNFFFWPARSVFRRTRSFPASVPFGKLPLKKERNLKSEQRLSAALHTPATRAQRAELALRWLEADEKWRGCSTVGA